ncbi:hypothetical protein FO519_001115 [Halicephalobus sp. NKZ332]|nr:hypothetical protein FO519_001115 [Halicephalobus sp. NKZ332]
MKQSKYRPGLLDFPTNVLSLFAPSFIMNVTFQDPPNGALPSAQRCRQVVEQLKKFLVISENPNASASQIGTGLSDVGFLLLRLKDQLLLTDQRSASFPIDFASKQHNGLGLLIKVVVVLQGIVNIANNKSSKFSSLLNRKNSATNVRRKASVSEADCMECIKLVLEKASNAWQILLENPQNLEVILYSINSPQLDSKCYSLEILIGLLDQSHGFEHLFRSLSVIAARTGDYTRLTIIVAQLKHGLHTSKLHIQILVARLMNKLMVRSPTINHRLLTQAEAGLVHYSPEYIEKLINSTNGALGGREILSEEMAIWRNLCSPALAYGGTPNLGNPNRSIDSGHGRSSQPSYESSEDSQGRRRAQTSLTKNIERQRLRRHGEQHQNNFYNNEFSQTLSKSGELNNANYVSRKPFFNEFETLGRMRRVKSESAMGIEDEPEDEHYAPGTQNRRLKRFNNDYSDYATPPNPHNIYNAKLSQSIHDLSAAHMSPTLSDTMPRRSAEAPGKFYTGNASSRYPQNYESVTLNRAFRQAASPSYSNASSQPEHLPGHRSSQLPPPHGGFSYLFPTLPIVDRVVGRSKTPDSFSENHMSSGSPGFLSPKPSTYEHPIQLVSPDSNSNDNPNNVVYIPINMVEKQKLLSPRTIQMPQDRFHSPGMMSPAGDPQVLHRYDKRRQTDAAVYNESTNSQPGQHINKNNHSAAIGGLGEDVRDALREFDYLNDYDAASVRSGTLNQNPTAIYHF